MSSVISKFLGGYKYGRFHKSAKKTVAKINAIEESYRSLEDSDLPKKTAEFAARAARGESLDSILPEAYALVKNAARRMCGRTFDVLGHPQTWDMVHYDVQLIGGIALHKNMVAEIATGEGKTLVATLPAYLNALSGLGCHIATVNEYLAMRDSQWMGNLYSMLGLSASCVCASQSAEEKRRAYMCDITYGTASEFGFDYLRDNSMARTPEEQVQRGFHFCLVDEADSVLIDEARTPLIISGPDFDEEPSVYTELRPAIEALVSLQHKMCNALASDASRAVKSGSKITAETLESLWLVKKGMPRNRVLRQLAESGLLGRKLADFELEMAADFNRQKAYALKERLYYTIDEKDQQSDLTEKGRRELSPADSYAFVLPDLAEMLAEAEAMGLGPREKFRAKIAVQKEYSKIAERIHALSQLLRAYSLYERDVEYIVSGGKVEIIDRNTGRVMEGRRWSDGLHQAVEAKERVEIENENKTYATVSIQNYFRMYAKLAGMTGTAESEASEFSDIYKLNVMSIPTNAPCRRKDLPDLIYKTRREKYQAASSVIRKAHARGQPVLVGTSSVEDSELLSRLLKMAGVPHCVLNAKNNAREAEIVARAGEPGAVTIATNMAGRGTDIKLGSGVAELGGLLVIGTEHHESSRVDRQLIGRCARQGDPGESLFIVSLEDDLLRLHADTSVLSKVIATKHRDGCAFSHPIFGRIIARAQKKVEGENYSVRKRLLQFDDSANRQREVVYAMRAEAMSADMREKTAALVREEVAEEVESSLPADQAISREDLSRLCERAAMTFPVMPDPDKLAGLGRREIAESLCGEILSLLEEKRGIEGPENSEKIERFLLLDAIDSQWRDHITRMEDLRNAIYLRGYAQKDPLNEYKIEAFNSFRELLGDIRSAACSNLFRVSDSRESMGALLAKIRDAYAKRRAKIA